MNQVTVPILLGLVSGVAQGLHPGTTVPLGSTLTVAAVVVSGAFWVGRYMQRLDNRLDALEKRIENIEEEIRK